MSDQQEKVFAEGIYVEHPHANAPEFVKYKISLLASKVIPFIQQYANTKGYVNLVLKISRDGSPYLEVDLWQPKNAQNSDSRGVNPQVARTAQPTPVRAPRASVATQGDIKYPNEDINPDDIPF